MELYIAILGVVSAVITVSLTNYYSKYNQLKFEERKLKEVYYINFMNVISEMLMSNFSEDSRKNFACLQNNLFLTASSDVVSHLNNLNDYLSNTENHSQERHNELLTNLVKAIRKDLFSSDKVNKDYPIIELRTIISKKQNKNK